MVMQEASRATEQWGDDYWLGHCEGFRVVAPEGRIGIVETVIHDDGGCPKELGILAGMFGTRVVFVPVADVAAIDPRAARITLRPGARILADP